MGEEKSGESSASNGGSGNGAALKRECKFRNVWAKNLEEEFKLIRAVVRKYPYIAMDTEFPGVVARPIGEFKSATNFQYQVLKCNVNILKLIQLGLTFFNEDGEMAPENHTWQFNFKFNLQDDMYAQDSIDLLHRAGLQFAQHERDGIRIQDFGELLTTSGLVLQNNVHWLSFHSGYDFGYLLRTMTLADLPEDEADFFDLLSLFFPHLYDIKIMLKQPATINSLLKGGLQEISDQLGVERIGMQHQAGSDSLLTGLTFFKMREKFFSDSWKSTLEAVDGKLYGLSPTSLPATASSNNVLEYESLAPSIGGTQPPSRNASCAALTQSLSQRNSPTRGMSPAIGASVRQSSVGDMTSTDVVAENGDTNTTCTSASSALSNGVFTKWDECKAQVDGFTGAAYKKFNTIEEAEKFVAEGGKHIPKTSRPAPYSTKKPEKGSKAKSEDKDKSDDDKEADTNNNKKKEKSEASASNSDDSDVKHVDVFTDGCCFFNGKAGAVAGIGVHWPGGEADDVAEKLDGRATNNHAEIKAACKAIEQAVEKGMTHIRINTDSEFMIKCMTEWIDKWRKNDWQTAAKKPVKNKEELIVLDEWINKMTSIQWNHVEAHAGLEPNEKADQLAKQGAKQKKAE